MNHNYHFILLPIFLFNWLTVFGNTNFKSAKIANDQLSPLNEDTGWLNIGTNGTSLGILSISSGLDDLDSIRIIELPTGNSFPSTGVYRPIKYRYQIISTKQPSQGRTLCFNLPDSIRTGLDFTRSRVWFRESQEDQWTQVGEMKNTASDKSICYSTNHFSEWIVTDDDDGIPVKLTFFRARALNDSLLFNWETMTETNNKGFNIQYSSSLTGFKHLAFVPAYSINHYGKQSYIFKSEMPFEKPKYFRLMQVDLNGDYSFSPIISINTTTSTSKVLVLDNRYLKISVTDEDLFLESSIYIYDAIGKIRYSDYLKGNEYIIPIPSNLRGVFWISVNSSVHKLVIQ